MLQKNLLTPALLLAASFFSTADNLFARDVFSFSVYEEANDSLRNFNDIETVLIGNSITQFWKQKRPDFFADGNKLVCRGISGQTTYGMLGRFREDVISLRPKRVVICGGINDIAENDGPYCERRTFGNIVSMAELAQANGIEVVLCKLLPADHIYWNGAITSVPDKVASLNNLIESYANDHGLRLVDYYTPLCADGSQCMPEAYSTDGIHPTSDGYAVMEQALNGVLNRSKD